MSQKGWQVTASGLRVALSASQTAMSALKVEHSEKKTPQVAALKAPKKVIKVGEAFSGFKSHGLINPEKIIKRPLLVASEDPKRLMSLSIS